MKTDEHLLEASLAGDRRAFAAIVERYKSLVCSVTYSLTGDFGVSEDLAQETFLSAWSNLKSIRNSKSLSAWLYGIARNNALRWLRKSRRDVMTGIKSAEHLATQASVSLTPSQSAIGKEQQALIWQALKNIPEKYRIPLVLYYREGKSVKLVAEATELSNDAVKQRLHRGRRMLREQVELLLEESLGQSRPGPDFTLGVLAVLPALSTGATAGAAVSSQVPGLVQRINHFFTSGAAAKAGLMCIPLVLLGLAATTYSNNSVVNSETLVPTVPEQSEVAYVTPEEVVEPELLFVAKSPTAIEIREPVLSLASAIPIKFALPEAVQTRSLHFPQDGEPIGMILYQKPGGNPYTNWRFVGPAQGTVYVPVDVDVMFRINYGYQGDLAELNGLHHSALNVVDLSYSKISDEALSSIARFSRVTRLLLDGTPTTDSGLDKLESMTTLEELSLRQTQITGIGLWALHNMGSLRVLDLTQNYKLTEYGLIGLPTMPQLETLVLHESDIDEDDLQYLSRVQNLRHLYLSNNLLKGDWMARLKILGALETLSAFNVDVGISDGTAEYNVDVSIWEIRVYRS